MRKLILLMAAASFLCSCGEKSGQDGSIHSVMTVQPEEISCEAEKHFAGIVKENAEVSLGFKTAGEIVQICVREGDHVRRGQLLARLDDKDYRLGVEALQIQYDQLQREVERMRQLYEGKSLSGNDYEKAVAGLEQLGVQLQVNKNKLSYTRLTAPCDGIIQKVNFERSEMVGAGTPVFSILDVSSMEVEISLPQTVYQQRQQLEGAFAIADGERTQLRLLSIIPKADNNQLYTARFALSGRLTAGRNVDVVIRLGGEHTADTLKSGYALPVACIFEHEGRSCIWTIAKDSTVHRQEVSVRGTDANGRAQVTSGLQGGETIVRAGVHALQDGERVSIIQKESETNVGGML